MTLDDIGNYTCEAYNEGNRQLLSAHVTITGIEILKQPDDNIEIICSIEKGKPKPNIKWEYRTDSYGEFDVIPDGVVVDENVLTIPSATVDHKGEYKCTATNIVGEGSSVTELKIRYAPKITNDENTFVEVMGGDLVELPCEVDAIPEATVRWEMYQDDVIVNLGDRHSIKDNNSLIQYPKQQQSSVEGAPARFSNRRIIKEDKEGTLVFCAQASDVLKYHPAEQQSII
ncbi:unnamed protein product [Diatraea saccharalis]|uniref:Ig-like domain-containing protein n=1 Tax=Diatraea saccharalis TaxID=40085 RepID=A0A9N9QL85_9NEOP|nr:unnamed protein product [Diatraea saccharalis]